MTVAPGTRLGPYLANDSEALSRLEREARAVAQLSHPNILAIYDFGRRLSDLYVVEGLK